LVVGADGMGGCNAGEVASEMSVQIILEQLSDNQAPPEQDAPAETNTIDYAAINALFGDVLDEETGDPDPISEVPFWGPSQNTEIE